MNKVIMPAICIRIILLFATAFCREEPDAKVIQQKILTGYWLEIRSESGDGITEDPNNLSAQGFRIDDHVTWSRRGELSESRDYKARVVVNSNIEPMQLDMIYSDKKSQEWVTPCIFKFLDGKLILVEPTSPRAVKFRKDGVYDSRPKDFVPTKENKTVKKTMTSSYLHAQD